MDQRGCGIFGGWVAVWASQWVLGTTAHCAALDINQYLEQVDSKGLALQIAKTNQSVAELKQVEGGLQYAPSLSINGSYTDDRREPLAAALSGSQTTTTALSASISQLLSWGMTAKLSYGLTGSTIVGSAFLLPSPFTYYSSEPKLEITQPLWSNGLGASTRAQREMTDALNMSQSAMERYKVLQSKSGAEQAYWRLAFARKTLDVQAEVLKRSKSLYDWNAKRVQMNLADKADLLQSSAAFQLRQLDVRTSEEEIRSASIAFNSERGLQGVEVAETLVVPPSDFLLGLEVKGSEQDLPESPRLDVVAAQQMERSSVAAQTVALERYKPTLDWNLTVGGNGIDSTIPPALTQSFGFGTPYFSTGLKFTLPLDIVSYADMREANRKAIVAAALQLDKATLDQSQEWKDLTRSFRDLKARLRLVIALANAQRQKLDHERDRLRRGRSTTYQVLLFEQDSLQADLGVLRLSNDVLRIYAKLKMFGANS